MGYGVMVTLQILVLMFQVRILVAQQSESEDCKSNFRFFDFSKLVFSDRSDFENGVDKH